MASKSELAMGNCHIYLSAVAITCTAIYVWNIATPGSAFGSSPSATNRHLS